MITLAPYDPRWPLAFAAEAKRLRDQFGSRALRIDHVGSTSVPDLMAKAIIDIQISVASLSPRGLFKHDMQALGYAHVDLGEFDLIYPYFRRPDDWPHTHHVHICEAGGEQERRHLAFRDCLRRHQSVAIEYAALKEKLARVHRGESAEARERYSLAKSSFIESVLARAFAEGLPAYAGSDA